MKNNLQVLHSLQVQHRDFYISLPFNEELTLYSSWQIMQVSQVFLATSNMAKLTSTLEEEGVFLLLLLLLLFSFSPICGLSHKIGF